MKSSSNSSWPERQPWRHGPCCQRRKQLQLLAREQQHFLTFSQELKEATIHQTHAAKTLQGQRAARGGK
eukprot:10387248-Lingulodinium_polyedra.AAC.1